MTLRLSCPIVSLLAIFPLAGCSNVAYLDQSPIRNYVVVTIENDSGSSVKVTECYARRCRDHDPTYSIRAGGRRDEAANNAQAGTAIFRVASGDTVRCLRMRYVEGQEHHAPLKVSAAGRCPWST
jgi:hypothetical protein